MKKTVNFVLAAVAFCFILLQRPYAQESDVTEFKILFGSCNRVELQNPFWEQMAQNQADVFIWGGDAIYADTRNMRKMKKMYVAQKKIPDYKAFAESILVMGTWDDHDYGLTMPEPNMTKSKKVKSCFLIL